MQSEPISTLPELPNIDPLSQRARRGFSCEAFEVRTTSDFREARGLGAALNPSANLRSLNKSQALNLTEEALGVIHDDSSVNKSTNLNLVKKYT